MAPIKMEFGETRVERKALSLTRADKDRILQNFAEKISVTVPNFGAQEFPLRGFVKSFLDQVQLPSVRVTFELHGHEEDVEAVEINATDLQVIGTHGGNFAIADTRVSYEFDADIRGESIVIDPCPCQDGLEGQQASRNFKVSWMIDIAVEPGVSGTYEVEDMDITVSAPCCCPPVMEEAGEEDDEDDDEEETGKERKKSKKKKGKGR
jgi:hypothetical protein